MMSDLDSLAERYLLGELDGAELEAAELRLADDTFFHRVKLVEDELIDAYLADELDPERRQRFETIFLRAPERQRRLQVSQLLLAESGRRRRDSRRRRSRGIALAAALLLVTAAGWMLVMQQESLQHQPRTDGETLFEGETLIELDLGVSRSAQSPTFGLADSSRSLRLRVTVDPRDLTAPVELVLRDATGSERWRGPAQQLESKPMLELWLAQGLPAGAYELEVLARPPGGHPTPLGYAYFDLTAP
ncbi:MAG: hypothetical protein AAF560_30890 [Acidobacteriota bacterium]